MKAILSLSTRSGEVAAVQAHLRIAFPPQNGWPVGGCPECRLPAPPPGSSFRVTEAIQTCHASSGTGLDRELGNSLPPGDYTVLRKEQHEGSGHSHWLVLTRIEDGSRVVLCYGYTNGHYMDWRSLTAVDLSKV